MRKLFVMITGCLLAASPLAAQTKPVPAPIPGLVLPANAVVVEPREDGFHLFIKKLPGVASLMLTEAYELPDHSLATYALRALEPNPVNGSETRLLNDQPLKQPHFSLIDSTVEDSKLFGGPAFHVLIPPKIQYGYKDFPNSRYGIHDLTALAREADKSFWFSIRTFEKPFGDYSGKYQDNAFELKSFMLQALAPPPADPVNVKYRDDLEKLMAKLTTRTVKSTGGKDLVSQIEKILQNLKGDQLDLIICLDTTKSMENNLQEVKDTLLIPVRREAARFKRFRLGLVFYRDYMEEYLNKTVNFMTDLDQVQKELNKAEARGGGDIPEAVLEAMYAGLQRFNWEADVREMIVVGDAPPHDVPRGSVTEAMVKRLSAEKAVESVSILLPY